jgi:hypothetical protein
MISKSTPYPSSWRLLLLEEALAYKEILMPLIYEWGIVGLENGRLHGSGYGGKLTYEAGV